MPNRVLTLFWLLAVCAAALQAQSLPRHAVRAGATGYGHVGWSVAAAGDVDGDGLGDVLVGALSEDANGLGAGSVRVLSGLDGAVLMQIDGTSFQQHFGFAVAGLGDVDGDGRDDFAIGANLDDTAFTNAGLALVVSGMTGAVIRSHTGDAAFDQMGFAIVGTGDLDQDGVPDYVVAAPRDDTNGNESGMVRVHSGATGLAIRVHRGQAAGDLFGYALAGLGDVDGDGAGDYAVGAPNHDAAAIDAGRVTVYSGLTGAVLGTLDGAGSGHLFGSALSGRGDLDGDGLRDLAIGAPFARLQNVAVGAVRVHASGHGALLTQVFGAAFDDRFGSSVDLGDLDGDGHADLLVGAPLSDVGGTDRGLARAYSGLTGAIVSEFTGPAAGCWFGKAVAFTGDVNGDLLRDAAVGAPFTGGTAVQAGRAEVVAFCGARPYGQGLGGLDLAWLPGLPGAVRQGAVRCEGAQPFAAGVALVGLLPEQAQIIGLPLLVATDPAYLVALASYGHDAQGRTTLFLNLQQPVLAGVVLYLQFFADGPALQASNGLELLFGP